MTRTGCLCSARRQIQIEGWRWKKKVGDARWRCKACHAGRYFPGCRCCVSRLLFVFFFFCILLPVVSYYRSWRRCLIASSTSSSYYPWKAYVVFVFCHWAYEFDSRLTACHLVCILSGTTSKTCTTWTPSSSNPSKSSMTGPGWAGRGTVFCVISKCLSFAFLSAWSLNLAISIFRFCQVDVVWRRDLPAEAEAEACYVDHDGVWTLQWISISRFCQVEVTERRRHFEQKSKKKKF